jgi:hypothetical protein
MPAPTLSLTRGSITLTMTPIEKNGFEIRGSITQPEIGGDWTFAASIFKKNIALIDDPDETATFACSCKVPFNEAPDETAAQAKLQDLVDLVYDQFVPTPAP